MKIELKPYTPSPETQEWREKMRAYRQAKARGEIPPPEKSEPKRVSLSLPHYDPIDTGGE